MSGDREEDNITPDESQKKAKTENSQGRTTLARPDSARGERQFLIKVNNAKNEKQKLLERRRSE